LSLTRWNHTHKGGHMISFRPGPERVHAPPGDRQIYISPKV